MGDPKELYRCDHGCRFCGAEPAAGMPPKVIHLEECDFPLRMIEELLRQSAIRISEFEKDPDTGLLSLRFPSAKGSG